MPRTSFHYRFVVCRSFFDEVMKGIDNQPKSSVFQALMFVSINSQEYKKSHNLMSKRIRDDLIALNPHLRAEYIKASLNQISEPESIEVIDDEVVRNIKYAIELSETNDKKLQHICILVGDSKKEEYSKSPHLKEISNVIIKSGSEAEQLVEDYKLQSWAR